MNKKVSGYETFDHTADIGLRAWAPAPASLLTQLGLGLFSMITDLSGVRVEQNVRVSLSAESEEELVLAWLKELLFIFETKKLLLCKFDVKKFEKNELIAEVGGQRLKDSHAREHEVKAVTRHQFQLKMEPHDCCCEVILDI